MGIHWLSPTSANIALSRLPVAQAQPEFVGPIEAKIHDHSTTTARTGRRVHRRLNERTVELHRREEAVAAALPAEVPASELRGVHDDREWIALVCFDDVGGRCPGTPWVAAEFAAALTALDQLGAVPVPATLRRLLPDLGVMLADDLGGWRRIAHDPPADLDAWTVRHLDADPDDITAVLAGLAGYIVDAAAAAATWPADGACLPSGSGSIGKQKAAAAPSVACRSCVPGPDAFS